MGKARVLMLTTDLGLGGTPLLVKQLARGLEGRAFEVRVACLGGEGPVAEQIREQQIPTYCLGAQGVWDFRVLVRLGRLLSQFRPQILHCHLMHANVTGRIAGSLMSVGHILATVHTAEWGKRWHLTAENLTCRLSDYTICVSESVARHGRIYSHIPGRRILTIPNGIDIDHFSGAERADLSEFGVDPGRKILIFVGRLDPVKNVHVILRALGMLPERDRVQLLIVGDGPERAGLEELSKELGLSERVFFVGERRDVAPLLKAADVFVMPSRWEGFGLAALEAMAAGVPVIAGRAPGLIDLLEDKKTALLVGPDNVQGLCEAISSLLNDPEYAGQLAGNAQCQARVNFSINSTISAYRRLYFHLLA